MKKPPAVPHCPAARVRFTSPPAAACPDVFLPTRARSVRIRTRALTLNLAEVRT